MVAMLACLVSRDREHKFHLGAELSDDEVEQIKSLLIPINALDNKYGIRSVITSWEGFLASLDTYIEGPASFERSTEVASRMSAWLSAFSSYIDHETAFWKRNFPEWADAYLEATRREFDRENRGYALSIKMRHYALHVDISGISITLSGSPDGGNPSVILMGDRDILLEKNKGSWGKPVTEFLQGQSRQFELLPRFVEAMNSLSRIRDHSLNLLLLKSRESVDPLRMWIDKAVGDESDSNAIAAIVEFEDDYQEKAKAGVLNQSHTSLPHRRFVDAIERACLDPLDPLKALARELQS